MNKFNFFSSINRLWINMVNVCVWVLNYIQLHDPTTTVYEFRPNLKPIVLQRRNDATPFYRLHKSSAYWAAARLRISVFNLGTKAISPFFVLSANTVISFNDGYTWLAGHLEIVSMCCFVPRKLTSHEKRRVDDCLHKNYTYTYTYKYTLRDYGALELWHANKRTINYRTGRERTGRRGERGKRILHDITVAAAAQRTPHNKYTGQHTMCFEENVPPTSHKTLRPIPQT